MIIDYSFFKIININESFGNSLLDVEFFNMLTIAEFAYLYGASLFL